jgi:hypothetical protein
MLKNENAAQMLPKQNKKKQKNIIGFIRNIATIWRGGHPLGNSNQANKN